MDPAALDALVRILKAASALQAAIDERDGALTMVERIAGARRRLAIVERIDADGPLA